MRRRLESEAAAGVEALPLLRQATKEHEDGPTKITKGENSGWESFRNEVLTCVKCGLCKSRTRVVFGVGAVPAPLMFIGEAPGREEDEQGEPFVGRSGRLLTQILRELGVARERVHITNIVRCRPPENRTPTLDEIRACLPYLMKQIRFVQPELLCTLGGPATSTLMNTNKGITTLRGRIHEVHGWRIFPTFHPAYVLRNMSQLTVLKQDLRRACKEAGLT